MTSKITVLALAAAFLAPALWAATPAATPATSPAGVTTPKKAHHKHKGVKKTAPATATKTQ